MSGPVNFDFKIPIDEKFINAVNGQFEKILDDETKLAVNNLLAKTIDPWVPYLEGPLSQTLEITPERIKYAVPYAHYQYYGDGFNHTKDFHPLATERWLEVAMETEYDSFMAQARQIVERRARELYG